MGVQAVFREVCSIDQVLALGAQLLEAFLFGQLSDGDVVFDRFALALEL
ncbi:MAG: hypothetical protein GY906_17565, partial [bacterium]|nr:hypothetical protein [bacterium]